MQKLSNRTDETIETYVQIQGPLDQDQRNQRKLYCKLMVRWSGPTKPTKPTKICRYYYYYYYYFLSFYFVLRLLKFSITLTFFFCHAVKMCSCRTMWYSTNQTPQQTGKQSAPQQTAG